MNDSSMALKFNKKALLIINPVSGKKLVLKHIPYIIRRLMDNGYLVTTCVTSRRGEATELAAALGRAYDLVCCTGGDGTLNETLTGLAREDIRVPIGYIPCGSTNDFANSLKLPKKMLTAAKSICTGTPHALDIGMLG